MATRRIIEEPYKVREAIHRKACEAISKMFPMKSGDYTVELKNIEVIEKQPTYGDQATTLMRKGEITERVLVDLDVKNANGKVIGSIQKHNILNLPWYTSRGTVIIGGNEYAVVSQMRTKSGVYTRKKGNEELESAFNLAKGANFKLVMNTDTGVFKIDILGNTLPAVGVLKILGAAPSDITAAIGNELYQKNMEELTNSAMERTRDVLYTKLASYKKDGADTSMVGANEKDEAIRAYFSGTEMDPETTEITLGTPIKSVNAQAIILAMHKIIEVYNGTDDIDERDNVEFQKIYCIEDLIAECIEKNKDLQYSLMQKVKNIDPNGKVNEQLKDIFTPASLTKTVRRFITMSDIARTPQQINPMEFVDTASIITRMGEGGIGSLRAVPFSTRAVHASYVGLIDPIAASESGKIGVDSHATAGAAKDDNNDFCKTVKNCKTGAVTQERCIDLYKKYVGFPDVKYKNPKPTDKVYAVYKNKLVQVTRDKLDYIIPDTSYMTTLTTNTIPFVNANQGNRIVMGDKHVQQSLPLVNPEKRLVCSVNTGNTDKTTGSALKTVGAWTLPKSPCNGTVMSVKDGIIEIKDDKGKKHLTEYSQNLPLAYKTFLDDKPIVKPGDKVKEGQVLADSNFTKDGEFATGKNLKVAYMPYFGYNHEDGVVLSESTAKKMTSVHSDKITVNIEKNTVFGKDKYTSIFPTNYSLEQLKKLDSDGVVKKGEILEEGDPVVLCMLSAEDSRVNQVLGMLHKCLKRPYRDAASVYDMHYPGEVVGVEKTPKLVTVIIKLEKPMQIGDKLAGSYGNKGVVAKIVPDDQMIKDEDGKPVDCIFTSVGVISRINPAQIMESTLGKIAAKTGKRYEVENFSKDDYIAYVRNEMKKNNVHDKETVTDPISGKKIKGVFVGVQYCHKLVKTTDTNYAARGIEGAYDQDEAPSGRGLEGPKAIGGMEVNALLAHNARSFLRESTALRSSRNIDFWNAFQDGYVPQFPQEKKTFNRFIDTLKQAGINVRKNGNELVAAPLTDSDILGMSAGELKNGRRLTAKDLAPEQGGLFDTYLTGGLDGEKWTHIKLAEPIVNPVFAKPAAVLLDLNNKDFQKLSIEEGGAEIRRRLNNIDVPEALKDTENALHSDNLTNDKRDNLIKRLKYLRALKNLDLKAGDAYTLSVLPVTPPKIRPITVGATGDLMTNDANFLYSSLIELNNRIKEEQNLFGKKDMQEARKNLQARVSELAGLAAPESPELRGRSAKGALDFISGDQPKTGYFQSKVIYGKMNMSSRATISPDMTLGLDEVGIPEDMAWTMYRPFIIRNMVQMGYTPLGARESIDEKSEVARRILNEELEKRPVVINRAPTLWRYGMLGAKPVLRDGLNIRVNPYWERALNADYDGDAMQVHVPVSEEAVEDAKRMFPSKMIFTDQEKGDILMMMKGEPIIGLYKATANVGKATGTPKHYPNEQAAWQAYFKGDLKMTDLVAIG